MFKEQVAAAGDLRLIPLGSIVGSGGGMVRVNSAPIRVDWVASRSTPTTTTHNQLQPASCKNMMVHSIILGNHLHFAVTCRRAPEILYHETLERPTLCLNPLFLSTSTSLLSYPMSGRTSPLEVVQPERGNLTTEY